MPSITYMNQSAPFWDFIASLEQQGQNHPFFSQSNENNNNNGEHGEHQGPPPAFTPWGWGGGWGGRGFPHRGPPRSPPDNDNEKEAEKEKDVDMEGNEKATDGEKTVVDEKGNGEGPSGTENEGWGGRRRRGGRRHSGEDGEGSGPEGWRRHGRCGGGRCGGGRHGRRGEKSGGEGEGSGSESEGWGGRRWGGRRGHHGGPHAHGGPHGPHHGPPGPHGHGGPGESRHGPPGPHGHHDGPHGHHGHHGPRGYGGRGRGWGGPWGWGRGGPFGGGAAPFDPIAFAANLFNTEANATTKSDPEDFTPEADIFDTPSAYVIHVSLPGVKKEDVGVNWDAEKSELSIAGVVYRPGNEEFLKTLEMGERKVGPFERKVRLGTRAVPAQIDAEGISAKLEDGILRIEVPKMEKEDYVEIRKVDI
ncbi:hypothetical protein K504DRAFT_457731, partial [Pleomassaria siparia CBS 279.74]